MLQQKNFQIVYKFFNYFKTTKLKSKNNYRAFVTLTYKKKNSF